MRRESAKHDTANESESEAGAGTASRREVLRSAGALSVAGIAGTGTVGAVSSGPSDVSIDVWPASEGRGTTRVSVEQGDRFSLRIAATNESTDAYSLLVKHQEIFGCGVSGFIPPTWYDIVSHTDDGGNWIESSAKPGWSWTAVGAGESVRPAATYEVPADEATGTDTVRLEASLGPCPGPVYADDSVEVEVLASGTGSGGYTDPLLDRYDTDGNGRISIGELGQAGLDYANGKISIAEYGQVALEWANS